MRQDFSLFNPSTPAISVAMKNSRKRSGVWPLARNSLTISAITTKNAPSPTNTVYVILMGKYFIAMIKDVKLTQTSIAVSAISGALDACFSPYAQPHSATAPPNTHKKPLVCIAQGVFYLKNLSYIRV